MKLLIKGVGAEVYVQNPNQTTIDIKDLDKVEDSSCLEIVIDDILDYHSSRIELLRYIVTKLRYDGTIYIKGTDIFETSRSIMAGNTSLSEVPTLIYDGKQSTDSLSNMCAQLDDLGIIILEQKLRGCFYKIIGRRPGVKD